MKEKKEKENKEKENKVKERINNEIELLKNDDYRFLFFILDTKGNPNGSIAYIYETALQLHTLGYEVILLHQDKDFKGVESWLGTKYSSLKHVQMKVDEDDGGEEFKVGVRDFLFIPEVFSNVMEQTKHLPCKRIVISQNFEYITEFIPLGKTWYDYGIVDVITTSELQSNLLKELFPFIRTKIVSPSIPAYFRPNVEPKELTVAILSKDQSNINKIVKPFYWKYPIYKWVTFKDLRGLPREDYADILRTSAITVWIDDETSFGYAPIEAIKSGNIVIGKLPNNIPDWMFEDNKRETLSNSGLWVDNINDMHKVIASVVKAWMSDDIPKEVLNDMEKLSNKFTVEQQIEEIKTVYQGYVKQRISELEEIVRVINQKEN
jgi:hypothetical protein